MVCFIIKQNGINQEFQKFTWKSQLVDNVYSFLWMMSLTLRHCLTIPNFVTL